MKVRFHTPHVDGEGCATPKPPALTKAIASLDGKVMDKFVAGRILSASVPRNSIVTIYDDWIGVRLGKEIYPGVREFNYRAILFDEVKEGDK